MPLGLLRRPQVSFCVYELRLRYSARVRLTQFSLNFISSGAELFYRPAHTPGKFWELLRAEQKQNNEEDYHHVRSHKIEDTSDHWSHKRVRLAAICSSLIEPIWWIYIPKEWCAASFG